MFAFADNSAVESIKIYHQSFHLRMIGHLFYETFFLLYFNYLYLNVHVYPVLYSLIDIMFINNYTS